MMKNFMPSIMVMIIYLMMVTVFSLLLLDFSSSYSFFLFIGKIIIVYVICYSMGYGAAYGITRIVDGAKKRREKRFTWYHEMGLLESAYLIELKTARKYSKNYWGMFFK